MENRKWKIVFTSSLEENIISVRHFYPHHRSYRSYYCHNRQQTSPVYCSWILYSISSEIFLIYNIWIRFKHNYNSFSSIFYNNNNNNRYTVEYFVNGIKSFYSDDAQHKLRKQFVCNWCLWKAQGSLINTGL